MEISGHLLAEPLHVRSLGALLSLRQDSDEVRSLIRLIIQVKKI